MIETIGAELFAELVTEVSNSPAWGVMVDETTDISVSKQLGLVVRSVNFQGYSTFSPCWLLCLPLLTNTSFLIPRYIGPDGDVKSKVLSLKTVSSGDSATLTEAILEATAALPMDRFTSFASDGASAMIGTLRDFVYLLNWL